VGKVTASLDTSHYRGSITKVVRVTTNDPRTSLVLLQLKALIVGAIEVTPTDMPVLPMTVGEPKPTELIVSASDGTVFDVLSMQVDPLVGVTVRPAPGTPGAARKVKGSHGRAVAAGSNRYLVTIVPKKDAPVGQSFAYVTLKTSLPKAESVMLRASLVVAGRVQVTPQQLVIQPSADALVLHVKITKPTGGALKILAVASSDPDFATATAAIAEGREYDLAVRYTGQPGRGPVSSRITVKTNEPGQDTIVIPLKGRI
jgi:hypothetical protein